MCSRRQSGRAGPPPGGPHEEKGNEWLKAGGGGASMWKRGLCGRCESKVMLVLEDPFPQESEGVEDPFPQGPEGPA